MKAVLLKHKRTKLLRSKQVGCICIMDSIYINYIAYSTYSTYLIRLGTGERQRLEWNEQRGTPFSTF